jgi:hypothetical protein
VTEQPGTEDPSKGDGQGTGAGGGGGGGGGVDPTSYAAITANAETSLRNLETSCKNQLMPLGLQLVGETDPVKQQQLITQINGIIAQCQTQFDGIIAQVELKLTTNNHPTTIIAEYRKAFQDEMDAGRALLESMNK